MWAGLGKDLCGKVAGSVLEDVLSPSGWGRGRSAAEYLTQFRAGGIPLQREVGDSGKVQGLPREGPQVPTIFS